MMRLEKLTHLYITYPMCLTILLLQLYDHLYTTGTTTNHKISGELAPRDKFFSEHSSTMGRPLLFRVISILIVWCGDFSCQSGLLWL